MKLSLIIDAGVRGAKQIDALRKSVGGLDRAGKQAANGLAQADRSMGRTARAAQALERAAFRMGYGIGTGARRGIRELIALERRMTLTQAQMAKLAYYGGRKLGGALRTGLLTGGAAVMAGGTAALWKVFSAGTTFESINTQLVGLEGSSEKAKKSLGWVTDFAARTPYELDAVAEAFIMARNSGIDPMTGSLLTLGDAGAALNKTYAESIGMLADAMTFQFERTREFGITATQSGDSVLFNYVTKEGQKAKKQVKKDAFAVRDAILDILGSKFGGGMDRLSKTTEGKWSNLMDRLTVSANRIWEGGLGSAVGKVLDSWGADIEGMEKDGSLKKWADEAGDALGDLTKDAGDFDWKGLAGDVLDVARAMSELVGAVRTLVGYGDSVHQFFNDLSPKGGGILQNWFGIGGPTGWIFQDSNATTPAQARANSNASSGIAAQRRAGTYAPLPFETQPRFAPSRPATRGFAPARSLPFERQGWPAAPAKPQPAPKGKLSIEIRTQPGTTATPTGLSATGIDLNVNTGRAMSGVA